MPDQADGVRRKAEEEEQRHCARCHEDKPLSAFARKSDGTGAMRPYCRECGKQQSAAYRALHPEQRERFNAWRRELRRAARRQTGSAENEEG